MTDFTKVNDFRRFRGAVRQKRRYIHDAETTQFLSAVRESGQKRKVKLPAGSVLYRAQIGFDTDAPDEEPGISPLPPKRMVPLKDEAREGRVNPKGIPCLYLANDRETAVAEVRPWRHAYVSVGLFETRSELWVVDFSADEPDITLWLTKRTLTPAEIERAVWGDINSDFSKPVQPSDTTGDYVPTQILSELFRADGCDGVAFKSSVGKGHNVALFDIQAARLRKCEIHLVKEVEYRSAETDNPYYIGE